MGIKFNNKTHQVATGTNPQDLLAVFKTAMPYMCKLIRFWVMCSDPIYPAGVMLDLQVLRLPLATPGSGGTNNPGGMEQDNSLGLSPLSICRQNDTTLATTGGTPEVLWDGAMQVWQGVDVVSSGENSIINYSSYGPTYDAFILRLATGLASSVKLSCGMIFEESY